MYRKINANIRKVMQESKDNCIQIKCKSIVDDMSCGRDKKKAYKIIKIITKSSRRNIKV